jgi:hypothetical protein
MPMAMYGCEHHTMTKTNLTKLRNQAAAAGYVRPMGVSSLAKMLCQQTTNDPCFVAVAAPLTRWAREVWLATGPEILRPKDCLTGKELHDAATLIRESILPQGPLLAVQHSLKQLKWCLPQAHIMKNNDGEDLDLTLGSPTMLKHYIVIAHQKM